MPFERIGFIKHDRQYTPDAPVIAPMFRRTFHLSEPIESASVFVCGLGYGYYWLNGKSVTEDLFISPVSDYRKTLWYNTYDVTDLLKEGENIFAVICGNGWYNENLKSGWDYDTAPWRDDPKFILELVVNGRRVLQTDTQWKSTAESPVIWNQLRSGEYFDARKFDPDWKNYDYDDSGWTYAATDTTPPTGVLRPCMCESIREDKIYPSLTCTDMGNGRYIFDFGQNISGFIRLTVNQSAGDEIIIRYGEEIQKNGELELNNMDSPCYYKESPFQTDRLICPDGEFTWSPKFVYHGFRYAEITGIQNPTLNSAAGVFVHQAVAQRSSFRCSEPVLNELFRTGRMATLSNLFYMPTDCPTREKLGWCNDAQASVEQMLTNFTTEKLFVKWLQDIWDAMLPDGQLPGIVPSSGWGYKWGNGPVSEGILFEVPYRLYLHTGDTKPLIDSLPYFEKYLAYLESREDENGDVSYGLDDWAHPTNSGTTPTPFINSVYRVKFYRIASLASNLAGLSDKEYQLKLKRQLAVHKAKYIKDDGTCKLNQQTAVAMLIYHDIYDDLAPLKAQLIRLVENKEFHHDCGMVGLRHLYMALNKCGLQEYAYRIVTAKGFPSYQMWLEDGGTTLYEMWDKSNSKNHHMYSDFMSWMMKTIIGIRCTAPCYAEVSLEPYFFESLDWAEGTIDTLHGKISVAWKKTDVGIAVEFVIPNNVTATFRGQPYTMGLHRIIV